ncbi:MAG: hypothetical protein PHY93_17400 [Bacteriovorax sp.]|nr:hypothetical protein [Bacteriovorax sp.]
MKKLKYSTVLFCLLFCFASSQTAKAYDATLSLGNLCEYVGKIQTDDSGGTNVCSFDPYLAGSLDYAVNNELILAPEIGLSFPKSGRDENISKMSFIALANAKYKFSMFHFIGGAGLFFTRISGSGGTQDLNNGNTTVSFPMPDSTVYSRNFIVNLGLGMNFNKDWSADLHTYVFNLLKSEDRAFSIAINATYHFGEF